MKKLQPILVLAVILFLLSGCNNYDYVDKEIKEHAVYADESHEVIIYEQNEYVRYECTLFCEIRNDSYRLRVTEADVPALLSERYGEYFYIDYEHKIIYEGAGFTTGKYYIRRDFCKDFEDVLENGLTFLCLDTFDENGRYIAEVSDEVYLAVSETLKTEPLYDTESKISRNDYIYLSDKSKTLMQPTYQICSMDGSTHKYLYDDSTKKAYIIPLEYENVFETMRSTVVNKKQIS